MSGFSFFSHFSRFILASFFSLSAVKASVIFAYGQASGVYFLVSRADYLARYDISSITLACLLQSITSITEAAKRHVLFLAR
ncbi:hypothetical protein THOD04_270014 [Vibrio owensii]|nr:hypothetical protein THOD04_270014 [Vibrio owensii]